MKTEVLLRVAYLVNQYPKVSHSFIRREIIALEESGLEIVRIALRGWDAALADPADEAERNRTRYLLRSAIPLVIATLRTAFAAPVTLLRALRVAYRPGRTKDRSVLHPLICVVEACRLLDLLREAQVSHLHAHFGTNGAEVAMLARLLGGPPYSFTVHGPEEFQRSEVLGLSEKLAHAQFAVAISAYGRKELRRWLGEADADKVKLVHCGLDRALLSRTPARLPDVPRLVCVGRLCAEKGQLLLIDAAAKLAKKGVHFELVLAGDGELRPQVERAIAANGLASQVRVTGWINGDHVLKEIEAARALVLPSFAEGLPVVIMEAMASGRPVLSTIVAGIPELVRNGQDGWLIRAGDIGALIDRMELILKTPVEDLERMGQGARARVRERHAIDVSAASLARAFTESAATWIRGTRSG